MSGAPALELEAAAEPSPVRLAGTLAVAGLISGLAIVGIFELTLPTIRANKAAALERAVFHVVPGSSQLQGLVEEGGALVPAPAAAQPPPEVYAAYDDGGAFRGYAIAAEGPGFQDTVGLLFGYDPARRRITGMVVLDSRETPGLGDKIKKDEHFTGCFGDLAVDPEVVLVKSGARARPNEVDAITGATISSRAVVRIVQGACAHWLPLLPAPGGEPPLAAPAAAGTEDAARGAGGGR